MKRYRYKCWNCTVIVEFDHEVEACPQCSSELEVVEVSDDAV